MPLTFVLWDGSPQQIWQPLIQHDALGHRGIRSGTEPGRVLGVLAELGGPIPHLEGGDDLLASVLEEVLIRPVGVFLGQLRGQVVVVPKPGNALSLQEAVLIPPGVPQVCKSRRDHQWGMLPLGLALPLAGGAPPAPWLQPSIPSSPCPSFLPRETSSLSEQEAALGPQHEPKVGQVRNSKQAEQVFICGSPFPQRRSPRIGGTSSHRSLHVGWEMTRCLLGMWHLEFVACLCWEAFGGACIFLPLGLENYLLSHGTPDPHVPAHHTPLPFPGVPSGPSCRDIPPSLIAVRDGAKQVKTH